ncbi:MAG: ABC transporter substrate-binding protein [Alphaproteobacteria bacterium]
MKLRHYLTLILVFGLSKFALAAPPGDLILVMPLEPPHLDPTAGAAAAIDEVTYANIFEGLTRIDETGAVRPALAESWTISSDGLHYTFKLRKNVKFHDGSAFNADDVVFSLMRINAPDSANAQKQLYAAITSVVAENPTTVVVNLKQPNGRLLYNLGWGDAVIVAEETASKNKIKPIGTGPFRFLSQVKGERVDLERNSDYWGTKAQLTHVTFRFITDSAAQVAALMAGDVDAIPNLGAPETVATFKSDPRFEVVIGTTEGEVILALNNARPPFSDRRVREALSYAIDRQSIIDAAYFGYGQVIGSHFSPQHPAYKDLTGRFPYDPARAKKLLADAGMAQGFSLTLKLPPPAYARRTGEILIAQLAKIGIQVQISPMDWGQWLEQVFKEKDFEATVVAHTEPLDIDIYGQDDYYFGYKNPKIKTLLTAIEATQDQKRQNELWGQIQEIVTDDAVNVFIFELPKIGVWKKGLHGLWKNSPIQANDLTAVHWEL